MRPEEIRPGGLVAGKYRIRTILGRGHGVLVEAFNTEFDQRVAIRLLLAGQTDDKELERFRREARTLAKLESEHVARIIDVGTQQDGTFYLVRQFLEGSDLATHVKKRGPLPLQEACLLVLQAAEAVSETNGHGIIFRELQPQHLFVTTRVGGQPLLKVIDFGTAKLMRDVAAPMAGEMTATTMLGLSSYSSPEIVRKAKSIDVRADVWSLGAILYFLLTGRPPFEGEMAMLMLQITKEEPRPVTQLRRDLPPEIDQILGWAMAKDVDGRFANVHGFAHALRPYVTAEGQVLIDRIGAITHAAKQRKKSGSVPPPPLPAAPPPRASAGSQPVIEEEESVTRMMPSSAALGDAPMERTMFLAGDFVPTPPVPAKDVPKPPAAGTVPFPGAGPGPVFGGAASGMAAPSPSVLGPSNVGEPPRPPQSSWAGGAGDLAMPGGGAVEPNPFAPKKDRRVLFGGLAAMAVLVPVMLVLLLVGGDKKEGGEATADSGGPVAVAPPTATTAEPQATQEPPPEPTATAEPVAANTAAPEDTSATKPASGSSGGSGTPPASTGGGSSPKATSTPPPAPTPTATAKPTATATATAAGGGNGTLVAVAVGGTCAFSVNGAAKGTTSTLKLSLAPGTYSVSCKPASGATKSRSVAIKSGSTAMAMFKLQ